MVKSIERITGIFKIVSAESQGLTQAQIAKALGVPKSTLSAFLHDLTLQGFLSLDAASREYSLGPLLLSLAGNCLRNLDVSKVSRPFLRQLADATGESTGLAIPKGSEMVLVAKENSPQPILHLLKIGQTAPLYATASGKIFLAYRSEEEIRKYIQETRFLPLTGKTIVDERRLRREMRDIRRMGLAYNQGEFSDMTVSIAAPVFDVWGTVVGSLVVMAPEYRIDAGKRKVIEDSLRAWSSSMSQRLGFNPEG